MEITVRADVKQAQRYYKTLRKGVNRAAARALNDTIRTVRAEGARAIQARNPALKIGAIKREMVVERATQNRLRAKVETHGRPLSMKLFQAKAVKKHGGGVTALIGGRRQMLFYRGQKAFIVSKYDHEVFVRRFPKGRQIRRFRGPSMPGVFRAQQTRMLRIAQQRWRKTFASRMEYEIVKAAKASQARARGTLLASTGAFQRFAEGQFRLPAGALG